MTTLSSKLVGVDIRCLMRRIALAVSQMNHSIDRLTIINTEAIRGKMKAKQTSSGRLLYWPSVVSSNWPNWTIRNNIVEDWPTIIIGFVYLILSNVETSAHTTSIERNLTKIDDIDCQASIINRIFVGFSFVRQREIYFHQDKKKWEETGFEKDKEKKIEFWSNRFWADFEKENNKNKKQILMSPLICFQ